jgi:uncharacterized protein YbjQ (UPF0145 family)
LLVRFLPEDFAAVDSAAITPFGNESQRVSSQSGTQLFLFVPIIPSNFGLLSRRKFCSFYSGMTQTHPLTTTTFELPGYRVVKSFGVVRGIIVRSRSIVGNIGAGFQSLFGGNISLYTSLCERTREDAFNEMITHAGQLGANAVIGVRFDATEISAGITEVLCYGTAVFVERQP